MDYPEFENITEVEGFKATTTAFTYIAKIKKRHNCGHPHTGKEAPHLCLTCASQYFELFLETYSIHINHQEKRCELG